MLLEKDFIEIKKAVSQ